MSGRDLACKFATERRVQANGIDVHLLEWGLPSRPTVCLLHGGSAHAHWFDGVAASLADRFHVVSIDQRGHGESAWPSPPAYATEDFAADLRALADALGWGRFGLVGHSMGGHNALAFAAWHPDLVHALVIVDSRPSIPEERLAGLRQRGRRALRLHPTREAAVAAFRLLPRETIADPALLAHLAEVGLVQRDGGWTYRFDPDGNRLRRPTDTWRLLQRITAPTLVVRGELSPILPRELAERMRSAIADAALVEIAGAYHHLVLDRPAAFVDAVRPFLAGVRA